MDIITNVFYSLCVIVISFIGTLCAIFILCLTNYFWTLLKLNMNLNNELTYKHI